MPLDFQNVPISFGHGINTKSDKKQLVPGKLTSLHNGVFKVGQEINKRNGYDSLTQNIQGGGSISAGVLVESYKSELIELDGSSLYSYNDSAPNWVNKGPLITTTLETSTVVRNNTQQTIQDSAINGSLKCFTWYDSVGQLGYSVFDSETNQSIVNNQTLSATGTAAKVLSLGTNFVIIYYDTGVLKYKTISTSTPTVLSSSVNIATDIDATLQTFDASVFNSRIYIAYASTTANRISMYYLSSSLVLSSRLDVTASFSPNCITVFGDASNNAWVAYGLSAISSKVEAFIANANLTTTVLSATTIESPITRPLSITGVVSGTTATLYYKTVQLSGFISNELTPPMIRTNTLTLSGSVGTASAFIRGVGLGSKVFSYNGSNYLVAYFNTELQASYFLLDSNARTVLKLSPSVGGSSAALLPEINQVSASVFQTASLIKDLLVAEGGDISTQTGVLSAKFTFSAAPPPAIVLGQNVLFSGGIINMYDGGSVVEHGFSVYPEGLTATATTSANSGTASGGTLSAVFGVGTASFSGTQSIQYSGTYEWTDNQGQLHRSAPSVPVTLNAAPYGIVGVLTGSMATGSSTITGVTTLAGVAPGQYVTFLNAQNVTNPLANATISAVSTSSITISRALTGTVAINGRPFLVSASPIAWMTAVVTAAAGTSTLTANSSNFDNLAVGQLLISAGTSDAGTSEADIFPPDTYITDVSLNGFGDVTITLSNPLNYKTSAGSFFYSTDVMNVSVRFPTLKLTSKSNVSLVLYKTEPNQTVFYRVTSPTSLVYNTKSVNSVTIIDTVNSGTLVGNQQLYTTGGELENIEAPAIDVIASFKSRAIAIPSENPLSWWYSKQVIPGSPVEFSDALVSNVDSKIGSIRAVGVLDEKIIFFGPGSKYYVVGDGPAPSGANNDFSQAQHITGSTGCSNQASILEIPTGLLYQDPTKGIYLLDRSLQEVYIGQDVEAYNDDPVTSAQTIPDTTSVRLTLRSGTVLIFDWFYNQWGNDPYQMEAIDSTLFDGEFVYVQSNGLVLKESPGSFTDNGAFIPLAPTTGWMNFAGVQGFQRVCELVLLGEWKSPHTLNINIYSDFDEATPTQTVAIPVLEDPGLYEFRIRLARQKCTSIKIAITDSQDAPYGEGYSISSMGFRVGVKKGLNKLSAGKSY